MKITIVERTYCKDKHPHDGETNFKVGDTFEATRSIDSFYYHTACGHKVYIYDAQVSCLEAFVCDFHKPEHLTYCIWSNRFCTTRGADDVEYIQYNECWESYQNN